MKSSAKTPDWMLRAIDTHKFHVNKIKEDPKWRLKNTSQILKRSIGSICEDLLVASWIKTHRVQLERFDYLKEALEYIREQQKRMQFEEIE